MKRLAHGQRVRTTMPALVVLLVGTLSLAAVSAAQTADETSCRNDIVDSVYRYTRATLKQVEKCHKLRNRGKVAQTVDCNDVPRTRARPAARCHHRRR